jgi:hypothetical protein
LEFLVFREEKQIKEKRKNKNEKTIYKGSSQQAKEEQGNLFGFSLILLLNYN